MMRHLIGRLDHLGGRRHRRIDIAVVARVDALLIEGTRDSPCGTASLLVAPAAPTSHSIGSVVERTLARAR